MEKKKGKKKKKEVEDKTKIIDEYKEHLQRLQAEFENYRKRVEAEKENFLKFSNKELILKLLDIIDNFELALNNTANTTEFVKGIELIFSQFYSLLEKEGLKRIESLGKPFDPNLHEALMQEESEKPENTVIEELQPGYNLHGKLLRVAKVKISKGGKNNGKEKC